MKTALTYSTASIEAQTEAKEEQKRLPRRYGLDVIRPHHRELVRRLVMGQTPTQIASSMGITQTRVNQLINTPLFKLELQRLMDMRDQAVMDIAKEFKEVSPVAVAVLERVMLTAKSDRLRKEAAESILDRAGFGAINKSALSIKGEIQHKGYSGMTDDELRRLVAQRLRVLEGEEQEKEERVAEAELVEVDLASLENGCSTDEQLANLTRLFIGEE